MYSKNIPTINLRPEEYLIKQTTPYGFADEETKKLTDDAL
jgi:hypothetical protein